MPGKSTSILSVAGGILMGLTQVVAQERPTAGLVHNTVELQSLTYNCSLEGRELTCSFVQVAVSRQGTADDLPKTLADAKAGFSEWKKTAANECKSVGAYESLLKGQVPPGGDRAKFDQGMARMTAVQKADLIRGMRVMIDLCKEQSEARFVDLVRLDYEKKMRTCHVWSSTVNAFVVSVTKVLGLS